MKCKGKSDEKEKRAGITDKVRHSVLFEVKLEIRRPGFSIRVISLLPPSVEDGGGGGTTSATMAIYPETNRKNEKKQEENNIKATGKKSHVDYR